MAPLIVRSLSETQIAQASQQIIYDEMRENKKKLSPQSSRSSRTNIDDLNVRIILLKNIFPTAENYLLTLAAQIGLYQLGDNISQRVKCFSCRNVFQNISNIKDLLVLHSKASPCCEGNRRILTQPFSSISTTTTTTTTTEEPIYEEEFLLLKSEIFFEFLRHASKFSDSIKGKTDFLDRMKSFVNSPFLGGYSSKTPLDKRLPSIIWMSLSGFRYSGSGTTVECSHCCETFKHFSLGDDAFYEHFRYSGKKCKYIQWMVEKYLELFPEYREAFKVKFMTEKAEKIEETTESRRLCVICKEKQSNILFEPCRHVSSCKDCSNNLIACPRCQQLVRNKKLIYLA